MSSILIAADRGGEVLYGDLGPVPHLTDAQVEDCAILHGAAFDGTRSECQWGRAQAAAVPGIFGPEVAPVLFRTDFVTNSNDSAWLSNPNAPITEFPRLFGSRGSTRTLRTRSGLEMVSAHTGCCDAGRPSDSRRMSLETLQDLTLANESLAGQLIRDDVVAMCRATPRVLLEGQAEVDLSEACQVLADWDLHANLESRGSSLFREFLSEANRGAFTRYLPKSFVPAVPFDLADPISTPRGLRRTENPSVLQSLAKAVHRLRRFEIPLDATLGELQGVVRGGRRIPLHGGPEIEGVFNKIEAKFAGADGYPKVTRASSSWILAVDFTSDGPRSRGILAYSLSANPGSPYASDQTEMFSRKEWLELPFAAQDVEAAAIRSYKLSAPRSP